MNQCTAPVKGHQGDSAAAAECPVHRHEAVLADVAAKARSALLPPTSAMASELNPLQQTLYVAGGSGDEYGEAVDHQMMLLECLSVMGEDIPDGMNFRPSPLLDREDFDYPASEIMEQVDEGLITADHIRAEVESLGEEIEALKAAGKDY